MYYGPNYDPSSASVVPSVSPSVSPSPNQPTDKESCEPDELGSDDNSDNGDNGEDDDDDDWITPDNLHRAREQMGGATTAPAEGVTVGCLTTDFTMQVFITSIHLS